MMESPNVNFVFLLTIISLVKESFSYSVIFKEFNLNSILNLPKVSLNVNLKVDTGFGDNWAEAH